MRAPEFLHRATAIRCITAVLAVFASIGLLHLYSPWETDMGPGRLELKAGFSSSGVSTLNLPPLGAVEANTHRSPIALTSTLSRLDARQVEELIASPDPADDLTKRIEADLDSALTSFVLRTLGVAAIVGLLVALGVSRRDRASLLIGPVVAVAAVGGMLGVSWRTYNLQAFDQPRFTGSLTEAPRVLDSVRRHVKGFDDARARVAVISEQIAGFYTTRATEPSTEIQEVRILHVSDLHSNPLGFETARRLAESFRVDAIIDTGDVTSFGSPVEGRVGDLLRDMPAPYYIVPGNHDSPAIRETLATVPGVEVLDERVVNIGGVEILGFADPTFTADNQMSQADADRAQTEASAAVLALLTESDGVDVLAVHNTLLAGKAYGAVPMVIAGHTHRKAVTLRDGTYGLVVGSTGAGGVGTVAGEVQLQYEAQILHFGPDGQLTAVDYVRLGNEEGDFSVNRSTVPLPLG